MGVCVPKHYYNRRQDSDELGLVISKVYSNTVNTYRKKSKEDLKKSSFTKDFYDNLQTELLSGSVQFYTGYSPDLNQNIYKKSFISLIDDIYEIIRSAPSITRVNLSELIHCIKDLDNNYLLKAFNANRLKVDYDLSEVFTIDRELAEENDSKDIKKEVNLYKFLQNTYGNCVGGVRLLRNNFSRAIFEEAICNFETGKTVTSVDTLNSNIIKYKNKLYNTLTSFLNTLYPDRTYASDMYNNGYIHRLYYLALKDFDRYLKDAADVQGEITKAFTSSTSLGKENSFLLAVEAYTLLRYFDSLLDSIVGRYIRYNKLFKNREVRFDLMKYSYGKDTSYRKNWSDSDARTAIQNSSRFSKFLADSMPLEKGGKDTGKNIGLSNMYSTMTKLASNISLLYNVGDKDSGYTEVRDLINNLRAVHSNPVYYLIRVFKGITNSKLLLKYLKQYSGFTDNDIAVVESAYKYFYAYDDKMNLLSYSLLKNHSINSIEYNELKDNTNIGKYSMLYDISSAINNCSDASYIYTEIDLDGKSNVKVRSKGKDRYYAGKYLNKINAFNYSLDLESRNSLQKGCLVIFTKDKDEVLGTNSVDVNIPLEITNYLTGNIETINLGLEISTDAVYGVLDLQGIKNIVPSNNLLMRKLNTLFRLEEGSIDLTNPSVVLRLLDKSGMALLSEDELLFKGVLKFIDDRLQTNFLTEDGLAVFSLFRESLIGKNNVDYLTNDLLYYAIRSQIVSDIYKSFEEARLNPDDTSVRVKADFLNYLKRIYPAFNNLTAENQNTYLTSNGGIYQLLTVPMLTLWVDRYATAEAIVKGKDVSSTSKNLKRTNDANLSTYFLGSNIPYLAYKTEEYESLRDADIRSKVNATLNSDPEFANLDDKLKAVRRKEMYDKVSETFRPKSAASALLFSKKPLGVVKTVINSDIKNRTGAVKSIRELKNSELFYNAIVNNFWKNYIDTGNYCVQPTTYSDKVKLIQYLINSKLNITDNKLLLNLDKEELIQAYRDTIGEASKLAYDNIIYKFSKLWGLPMTMALINSKLKGYTELLLVNEAQAAGIRVEADLDYRIKKVNGKEFLTANEVLDHERKYSDINTLRNKFAQQEILFVNDIVNSGLFFYIDYHDTSYRDREFERKTNKEKLEASTNPVAKMILNLYPTEDGVNAYMKEWVSNGKLILAYDSENNPIVYKNTTTVSKLNPLLEKYFYIDTLLSNNLRLLLTGFETNHPDKSKYNKLWNSTALKYNISNELLGNTRNISKLLKAKIIWGHPGIGKTTYLSENPNAYLDFDEVFNSKRNELITNFLSNYKNDKYTNKLFLADAYRYLSGDTKGFDAVQKQAFLDYENLLRSTWENIKISATAEGKKIFASPVILLKLFKDDFDLVLNVDDNTFLLRVGNVDWKSSINEAIATVDLDKVINIGNLYMSDIIALNDGIDLFLLNLSTNPLVRRIAEAMTTIVENISQSTLLKRNVIIPATMNNITPNLLNGVTDKIKVAIIYDVPADVYNFMGDKKTLDSMDGSAFTTTEQAILENNSLNSLEVGLDKKNIWHNYNQSSSTAGLMKFAAYAITNERMRIAKKSNVDLVKISRKMRNLQWANFDADGNIVSWNTPNQVEIKLGYSRYIAGRSNEFRLKFNKDILLNRPLYYKSYDSEGNTVYKQIIDFGKDDNGYYTKEIYVDNLGFRDIINTNTETVYHYFDKLARHHKVVLGSNDTKNLGEHLINSLFELWKAMGGLYSQEIGSNGVMTDSENSNYAVVGFMNLTLARVNDSDQFDRTLRQWMLPLKHMMIGYLTNNSAMKNGALNRNSVNRWFDDEELAYMEMDADGLGTLMDADHDVEYNAEMTEPSLVITALESGGYMHNISKLTYKNLGRLATIASKVEINSVNNFLTSDSSNYLLRKSKLYDITTKSIINGINRRNDNSNLTDDIIKSVEKNIGRNLVHSLDKIKVPASDPNIYSLVLPTIANLINSKSIKRPFPGSGCVMIPAYDTIMYYLIGDRQYLFDDLVQNAIAYFLNNNIPLPLKIDLLEFEKAVVENYLNILLRDKNLVKNSVAGFIPSDIVDFLDSNEVQIGETLSIDTLDLYYAFTDIPKALLILAKPLHTPQEEALLQRVRKVLSLSDLLLLSISKYRLNITRPKNLAPSRITFETEDGRLMNIFDIPVYRNAYFNNTKPNKKAVSEAFLNLDKGFFMDGNKRVNIKNLLNLPAEMIVSNMYSLLFNNLDKSVALIMDEGPEAFKLYYEGPMESSNYDIEFIRNNGNNLYVSFLSPREYKELNTYEPYKESNLLTEIKDNNIDVYLISDDNRKLFRVGRYIKKEGYNYLDGFYNLNMLLVALEEALKLGYSFYLGLFRNEAGIEVSEDKALKEGYIYKKPVFTDENGKAVKDISNLKAYGSLVYEYVEFVSKYKVREKYVDENKVTSEAEFDKYYINMYNLNRVFGESENPDDDKYKLKAAFVASILDGIYSTSLFAGLNVNSSLSRSTAKNIVKFVSRMQTVDSDFRELVLNKIVNRLNKLLGDKNNTDDTFLIYDDSLYDAYDSYFNKLSNDIFVSWLLSLYFIASRIPAQTLLSFMLMKTIAYSGNTQNKVYVSHWLTWLLGSDYDIDKAYITGQEFGDNGKLIKFSDLFDYSSLKSLLASLKLPIPRNLAIITDKSKVSLKDRYPNAPEYNITRELLDIALYVNNTDEDSKVIKLLKLASIISNIYEFADDNDSEAVYIVADESFWGQDTLHPGIADSIIKDLIKHERTTISLNLESAAYRNSIASNIRNIVLDLKNMNLAYSPVAMDDLQDLAADSSKGAMIADMSLMNPLTKYIMLTQNMTGKKVISIAAVGEKIFFNLSYYFNEGIRKGTDNWIRNMLFSKTFNRILGRYNNKKDPTSSIESVTKTCLANANFYNYEHLKSRFVAINQIDDAVRKELGFIGENTLTEEDIKNNTPRYQLYILTILDRIGDSDPVDLVISLYLSAATDNAKELILSKINCGDNLAGCHLYLAMLGFDLKDIVTFMTSPCVDLINSLTESNFMDSYILDIKVEDAIEIADGNIDASKFLFGSTRQRNLETGETTYVSRAEQAYDQLENSTLKKLLIEYAKSNNLLIPNSMKSFINVYIRASLDDNVTIKSLSSSYSDNNYEDNKLFLRFADYVERIIYVTKKAMDSYTNKDDYYKDLEEFRKIYKSARELLNLGNTFLGLNQGLPSDKVSLQSKLRSIRSTLIDREKFFGITSYMFSDPKNEDDKTNKLERYDKLLSELKTNNEFLNIDKDNSYYSVDSIIKRAYAFGLVRGFNIENWLYNKELTLNDIVNSEFIGDEITTPLFPLGKTSIKYRDLVIDYYNTVKDTFNTFDVNDKIPLFRAITELLKTLYVIDLNASLKSKLANIIFNDIYKTTNFIDERLNRIILNYINDLLISSFFNNNVFSFPIYRDLSYLDDMYINRTLETNWRYIDLNTSSGRANFKYVFESILLNLRSGRYGDVVIPNASENRFLQDLSIVYDRYGAPSITLGIDLMGITDSNYTERTFLLYLDGLLLLKTIYIGGTPLSDWFMLYNLFVNQNLYGSDRLTAVFKNFVTSNSINGRLLSVLELYFRYIADLDYNDINNDLLETIGYNLEDLLIRMAPFVPKSEVDKVKYKYIVTTNDNGEYITKVRSRGGYVTYDLFPSKDLLDDSSLLISEALRENYKFYLSIPMKNQDLDISLKQGLLSRNIEDLARTLEKYAKKGLILIYKENC